MDTLLWDLLCINVKLLVRHQSLFDAHYALRKVLTSLTVVRHKGATVYVLRRTAVIEVLH
jgi:hypothetical protein